MWDLCNIFRHAHLLCVLIGLVGGASIGGGVGFEGGGGVRGWGAAAIGQLPGQRTYTLFLVVYLWVLESWSETHRQQVMNDPGNKNELKMCEKLNKQHWELPRSTKTPNSTPPNPFMLRSPVRKLICRSSSFWMLCTHSFLMSMLAACSVSLSDEPRHNSTNLQGSLSTCSSMLK